MIKFLQSDLTLHCLKVGHRHPKYVAQQDHLQVVRITWCVEEFSSHHRSQKQRYSLYDRAKMHVEKFTHAQYSFVLNVTFPDYA